MSTVEPLQIHRSDAASESSTPHLSVSPEMISHDCHTPIPEEYEDETSSETVEPLTPTSETLSHDFHHHKPGMPDSGVDGVGHELSTASKLSTVSSDATLTTATSKATPLSRSLPVPPLNTSVPTVHLPNTPTRKTTARIKSLFRRSTAQGIAFGGDAKPQSSPFGLDDVSHDQGPAEARPAARRTNSFSLSPFGSARTSKSNTPPSPGSPNLTMTPAAAPSTTTSTAPPTTFKPSRSSTGLQQDGRVKFSKGLAPPGPERHRSTSMTSLPTMVADNSISMHAETGVGLKSRRMSTSLPDDFYVDTVELNAEFVSSSIVPGRRGKLVGSGATANVKLMARRGEPHDVLYAVKEFRKKGRHESEEDYEKKLKSEFCIAQSLHHPNIVQTVRLCTHNGRWNHVMEYCSQGELYSLVQKRYMTENDRCCFLKQLFRGVVYLHAHGIAHRDIKLENLLVTQEGTLKITDFGVSEVFCGEHPGLRVAGGECGKNMKEVRRCAPGICGSLPYIAPEVLLKQGDYDPRPLDVWSCAIVYMTMKFGGSPWESAERRHTQYEKFMRGWETFFVKHPDQLITDESGTPKCGEIFGFLESQAMRRLLLRMLHPNPAKRITIHEALNDRWVKTIECCSVEGEATCVGSIDVANKKTCRLKKSGIKKLHNHLPPPVRRLDALHPTF